MKHNNPKKLLLAAALSLSAGVFIVSGGDFTTDGGELLKNAELLKASGGIAYVVHDGGVAELPVTPRVVEAFHFDVDGGSAPADDLLKLEIRRWLISIKGSVVSGKMPPAPSSAAHAKENPLRIISAEKLAAYKKAAGEKLDKLTVNDGTTYTNVTITKVNQAYVYFSHDNGVARVFISDLPGEWAERFDFNPAEAAVFIEDEQANKNLAETQKERNDLLAKQRKNTSDNGQYSNASSSSSAADRAAIRARKLALEQKVAEILNRYENRGKSYKKGGSAGYISSDGGIVNPTSGYSVSNPSQYRYSGGSWSPRNPMMGNIGVSSEARELHDEWLELNKLDR